MNSSSLETVIKEFECPICEDYMVKKIALCRAGHNLCFECKNKLQNSSCPVCRADIYEGRNFTLEKIMSVMTLPCRNKGCTAKLKAENIKSHEETCSFGKQKCMLATCHWEGRLADSKEHILKVHNNLIDNFNYVGGKFVKIMLCCEEIFFVYSGVDEMNLVFSAVQNTFESEINFKMKVSWIPNSVPNVKLSGTVPCISRCAKIFSKDRVIFSREMLRLYNKDHNINQFRVIITCKDGTKIQDQESSDEDS